MRTLKCLIFNKFNFKRSPKSPKAIQRPLKSPKGLQTPQRHPKTPWEALGGPWTPTDAHGHPGMLRHTQRRPEMPKLSRCLQHIDIQCPLKSALLPSCGHGMYLPLCFFLLFLSIFIIRIKGQVQSFFKAAKSSRDSKNSPSCLFNRYIEKLGRY